MSKFLYFFLLNLLLLSKGDRFDARLLDPPTLDKIYFEIDNSGLSEVENVPTIHKRGQTSNAEAPLPFQDGRTELEGAGRDKYTREAGYSAEAFPAPGRSPAGDGNGVRFRAMLRKWRDLREKAKRKKRVLSKRPSPSDSDRAVRYLDYTNSQMPFNEGKMKKNLKTNGAKIAGETLRQGNLYFDSGDCFDPEAHPERLGRSMRRRFEAPLGFQEKSFEADDPLLEYSRVRRFLDQQRAKQRGRMPTTLEAKEAAMSRVLDPNLNSDGILEPHVRKRRAMHSKKRDLSFATTHRSRRRPKRRTRSAETARKHRIH